MLVGVALLCIWVIAVFIFSVVALTETRRLLRQSVAACARVTSFPALAILRPCAGLEPELEENLLSTVTARYDGPRELFVLVASKDDPAYAIAERVRVRAIAEAPGVPVRVVVTEIATRHNRKVAQMIRAERMSEAPVIVVIDSDIALQDDTLPALIAALMADQ